MGGGRCRARMGSAEFLPHLKKRQASQAAARLDVHAIEQFLVTGLLACVRHRLVRAVSGVERGIGCCDDVAARYVLWKLRVC